MLRDILREKIEEVGLSCNQIAVESYLSRTTVYSVLANVDIRMENKMKMLDVMYRHQKASIEELLAVTNCVLEQYLREDQEFSLVPSEGKSDRFRPTLSDYFFDLRQTHKLGTSKMQLAECAKCSIEQITKLEKGCREVSPKIIYRVFEYHWELAKTPADMLAEFANLFMKWLLHAIRGYELDVVSKIPVQKRVL